MCAVLKTLHTVKHILNEEECRSVRKAGKWWWNDLAVVIAVKPPGAVQETLGVLQEYTRGLWYNYPWYDRVTKGIKSKLRMFRHQLV